MIGWFCQWEREILREGRDGDRLVLGEIWGINRTPRDTVYLSSCTRQTEGENGTEPRNRWVPGGGGGREEGGWRIYW